MQEKVNRPAKSRIRKQTKMPKRYLPSVLVLYSKNNEKDKAELTVYFKKLERDGLFKNIKYRTIEDQTTEWWLKAIKKWDVFVLLVSAHLTNHYTFMPFFSRLKTEHKVNRAKLLPILMGTSGVDLELFKKLDIFPANGLGLHSDHWRDPENFYTYIFPSLTSFLKAVADEKTKHRNLWNKTTKIDSEESYRLFLDQYPHSKYQDIASLRKFEMTEERLWKAVQNATTIAEYCDYLANTDSIEHRYEIAFKISELEANETGIWEEIKDSKHLCDLLDFQMKFPDHSNDIAISKQLDKLLYGKHNQDSPKRLYPQTNVLDDCVERNLYGQEKQDLRTLLKYLDVIEKGLDDDKKKKVNTKDSIQALFILFIFIGTILISPLLIKPTVLVLFLVLGFLNIPKMIFFYLENRNFLKAAKRDLKPLRVFLRVYAISHNKYDFRRAKLAIFKIERDLKAIKNKSFWDYFIQLKAIKAFELEKYLSGKRLEINAYQPSANPGS